MRIGTLHSDDLKASIKNTNMDDPYAKEPEGSALLNYHMTNPTNAEAPANILTESYLTPDDLFFVRNHHPTPLIDEDKHMVNFTGLPSARDPILTEGINLSITDIKTKYKKHNIVSSIQCGGNRRAEMNVIERTNGSPWATSAISTAEYGGARLVDVLKSLGVTHENVESSGIKHIIFVGAEDMQASVPIRKALDEYGDSLLAYEQNGKPIPQTHGYPLRFIAPGHVGVRNVKWVSSIILSKEEATGPWQRGMSYKGFGPSTRSLEGIDVEAIPSLQEQPVQSAITVPTPGTVYQPGDVVTLKGYAYSGGGRGIVRVDVSIDGGKNWLTATMTEGKDQPLDRAWAWTLWEIDAELPEDISDGKFELICKATDASYNVQPDSVEGIWNLRGINNNSWHRVQVVVEEEKE